MKLNLFNGIIVFEGSVSELRAVMADMESMTPKLVDLQLETNNAIIEHQTALTKIEANKNRPQSQGHLQ